MATATLAACTGPILALLLVNFAENKVSGFALTKLFSGLSNFSLFSWFVPMPWQLAIGWLPSYWPMKLAWQAAAGASWPGYALVSLLVNGVAVWLLLRRFRRVLFAG